MAASVVIRRVLGCVGCHKRVMEKRISGLGRNRGEKLGGSSAAIEF